MRALPLLWAVFLTLLLLGLALLQRELAVGRAAGARFAAGRLSLPRLAGLLAVFWLDLCSCACVALPFPLPLEEPACGRGGAS